MPDDPINTEPDDADLPTGDLAEADAELTEPDDIDVPADELAELVDADVPDEEPPINDTAADETALDDTELVDESTAAAPDEEPPGADDLPDRSRVERVTSWVIVVLCAAFVAVSMHPRWLFANTTPTGGDMGAHVWGPAYLRDHLLPQLRLSGWTPDWYAGFPAYLFYMVVPSLFIVALNVGVVWPLAMLLSAAGAAAAVWVSRRYSSRVVTASASLSAVLWCLLVVPVPYNIAFKLVAVSGLVALPFAAFAFARAARLSPLTSALVTVGATAFLYETGFTIFGGNITSTMAGEFAFSISLAFAVAYLAVLVRLPAVRRSRVLAAVLFAMTILCHLIPAIFAVIATLILVFTRRGVVSPWWDRLHLRWMPWALIGVSAASLVVMPSSAPYVLTVAVVAAFIGFDRLTFFFAAVVGPVGFMLAAFWFLPFFLNSTWMNDMGWEKYTDYAKSLWPDPSVLNMPYRNVVFALGAVGVVLSLLRRVRLGGYLALLVTALAWVFVLLPQYRLWNARILPFYFLGWYLLAGLGVALVIAAISDTVTARVDARAGRRSRVAFTAVAFTAVAVLFGGTTRLLPGGSVLTDPQGVTTFSWMGLSFPTQNVGPAWAEYNFQGLEGRDAYPEFAGLLSTMGDLGESNGCGTAMWEYQPSLDRFGTPMALMLLPYFTDGCIGSSEGLYFEASSTTPFHFLTQSEVSLEPSRAQRDMPYAGLDLVAGVEHMRQLGVRYYMATSADAVAAARSTDGLSELASAGPWTGPDGVEHSWVVFEVEGSDLVVPLEHEPVVLRDADDHVDGWVYDTERAAPIPPAKVGLKTPGPAVEWFMDPSRWGTLIASDGPSGWARRRSDETLPAKDLPKVRVSNVERTNSAVSFDVDKPGVPVLVRTSYFPNWEADGADGPWRVAPNMMVVVPTDTTVTLSYGTSSSDLIGWLVSLVGVAALGGLWVLDWRDGMFQRRRRP